MPKKFLISLLFIASLAVNGCLQGVSTPIHVVDPKPPVKQTLSIADVWIVTVEQTEERPQHLLQSQVIADLKYWDDMIPGRWRHYDADAPAAKTWIDKLNGTKLPAMVFAAKQPAGTLKVLFSTTVPETTSKVTELIDGVTK